MGKVTGFIEYTRQEAPRRAVAERLKDYREIEQRFAEDDLKTQAARCMDCGVPFCHTGCPLGNIIPDWNDLVYAGRWKDAVDRLHKTNNFPEVTGRVCPAPCETECILGITDPPVAIKQVEREIADRGWDNGWITPQPPEELTGKKVAVIGGGPAGLAGAQQLTRAGHSVTVFERDDRVGGLLTYGIPDFKMEKNLVARRVEQMEAEGTVFRTGVNVGTDITMEELQKNFDAVLLAAGAGFARPLSVPGADLKGVVKAMTFLPQQNKRLAGVLVPKDESITATGKRVAILGGGDTGADCLGTSHRQGAAAIYQLEILPQPEKLKSSTSHEEGGERLWGVLTKKLEGDAQGNVTHLHGVKVTWSLGADGRHEMQEVPGSEFVLAVDLVILAMGFLGPEQHGVIEQAGLNTDPRSNVAVDVNFMTSVPGVFAAGDMKRGASLVVHAIYEGRQAAKAIDQYLMGKTRLE